MTKQVRDWNELEHWKCEAETAQKEVNLLTMQNEDLKRLYAAEKERADIAELAYQSLAENAVNRGEYESLLDKHTAMTKAYKAAEAREKKLREAIEAAINENHLWQNAGNALKVIERHLKDTLESLYPEEEEDKVTKREELMKQIKGYSMWPPKEKIEQMTDEELERYIDTVDLAFKAAFEEDEA